MGTASRLRAIREERGLTVQELARRAGVTRQTIYTAEAGTREPTTRTLRKLAEVLGIAVADLLNGEPR